MTTSLAGKVALVTGARGGLGAAIAVAMARLGATVIAAGRRPGDGAATAEAAGNGAVDFALDVADLGAIPTRVHSLLDAHGRIDIVVNNAGIIAPMARLGEIDAHAFDASLTVNVSGPAAIVNALWPHMLAEGGGRIINISSGAANRAISAWAAYCAGKAALLMLTRSIELEGKSNGIRGFSFAPGLVDTGMQSSIRAAKINEVSDIPRETLLPPEQPARCVAWLATGEGDDLAGQALDIRQEGLLARVEAALG